MPNFVSLPISALLDHYIHIFQRNFYSPNKLRML